MTRIGLLGGTFDPPHLGHQQLAIILGQQLNLTDLWLLPAGQPWQKNRDITAAEHRLKMTQYLAHAIAAHFEMKKCPTQVDICCVEIHRDGPSYAVETIETLCRQSNKDTEFIWLMGADQFQRLHTWHRWEDLVNLVSFAVAARPGHDPFQLPTILHDVFKKRYVENPLALNAHGKVWFEPCLNVPLSSTMLREQFKALDCPEKHLLPEVLAYIRQYGLY
jgi:nicotinate-nucleotide adenylyltransferase